MLAQDYATAYRTPLATLHLWQNCKAAGQQAATTFLQLLYYSLTCKVNYQGGAL